MQALSVETKGRWIVPGILPTYRCASRTMTARTPTCTDRSVRQ